MTERKDLLEVLEEFITHHPILTSVRASSSPNASARYSSQALQLKSSASFWVSLNRPRARSRRARRVPVQSIDDRLTLNRVDPFRANLWTLIVLDYHLYRRQLTRPCPPRSLLPFPLFLLHPRTPRVWLQKTLHLTLWVPLLPLRLRPLGRRSRVFRLPDPAQPSVGTSRIVSDNLSTDGLKALLVERRLLSQMMRAKTKTMAKEPDSQVCSTPLVRVEEERTIQAPSSEFQVGAIESSGR